MRSLSALLLLPVLCLLACGGTKTGAVYRLQGGGPKSHE